MFFFSVPGCTAFGRCTTAVATLARHHRCGGRFVEGTSRRFVWNAGVRKGLGETGTSLCQASSAVDVLNATSGHLAKSGTARIDWSDNCRATHALLTLFVVHFATLCQFELKLSEKIRKHDATDYKREQHNVLRFFSRIASALQGNFTSFEDILTEELLSTAQ